MHFQFRKTLNRGLFPPNWSCLRRFFPAITILFVLINGCRMNQMTKTSQTNVSPKPTTNKDAESIHREAIAVDMHADTTQRLVDDGLDLDRELSDGHFDAVRAKRGGLDAQFFSIWVEPQLFGGGGDGAIKRADDQINAVKRMVQKHPDTWELATTASDVRRIAAAGKMAALFGLEGGYAIDEKLENVDRYYKMGVRYMSPAWSVSTSWAGSSGDVVGNSRGLNDFGRQVVHEMNRVGMMLDVSHVSDKTFWDIVENSTAPVIATHSGCRAIANVPRNLTDEMIKAIARTGGVVNVIFYPEHLEPGYSEKKKQVDRDIESEVQRASEAEKGDVAHKKMARDRVRRDIYAIRLPPVTVSRLVDHIDHVVKLVGIDYVGIGSDFDGVQVTLSDLSTVADLPNLTKELLRRGYTEQDVDKILGGNMLRVLEAVQKN
jgi:membrane dipeptidase